MSLPGLSSPVLVVVEAVKLVVVAVLELVVVGVGVVVVLWVVVVSVVDEVVSERRGGVLTLGLAAALWASSTGMYAIMQQMNIAYGIVERRSFVRARATALGLTLLFAVLVIGAFSAIVLGDTIFEWLRDRVSGIAEVPALYTVFRWIVVVLALNVAIALIYRYGPNRKRALRLVTPGTVTATALMIAGSRSV